MTAYVLFIRKKELLPTSRALYALMSQEIGSPSKPPRRRSTKGLMKLCMYVINLCTFLCRPLQNNVK